MVKYHHNSGVSLETWAEELGLAVHLFTLKREVIEASIRRPSTYAALADADATREDLEEIYRVGIVGSGHKLWDSDQNAKVQKEALDDLCMKLMKAEKVTLEGKLIEVPMFLTAEGLV